MTNTNERRFIGRKILSIAFAGILCLVCACQKDKSDNIATIQVGARPCEYHVKLSWQGEAWATGWVIRRSEGATARVTKLPARPTEFLDSDVQCGKHYRYDVSVLDGSTSELFKSTEVTIPTDLEVTGTVSPQEIKGHNRLFIRKGARIVTQGTKFTIDVTEIISSDAIIETFAENQTAPLGVAGRHGGSIHIKAVRATGLITLYSRGENGAAGNTGATGLPGYKGNPGADGDCVKTSSGKLCSTYTEGIKKMIIKTFLEPSKDLDPKNDYARKFLSQYQCSGQTLEGGPGGQGGQGGNGDNGYVGGDSAEIYVDVQDASEFEVKPIILPGIGGKGGDGGHGGAGGRGGEPGKSDLLEICKPAPHGPFGPQGFKGAAGKDGPSGKPKPVCVKIGPLQGPDCDQFTVAQ